jgi:hypothetical protein
MLLGVEKDADGGIAMMMPMGGPPRAETTTIMSVKRLTIFESAVSQHGGPHA